MNFKRDLGFCDRLVVRRVCVTAGAGVAARSQVPHVPLGIARGQGVATGGPDQDPPVGTIQDPARRARSRTHPADPTRDARPAGPGGPGEPGGHDQAPPPRPGPGLARIDDGRRDQPAVNLQRQLGDADYQPRLQQLGLLVLRHLGPAVRPALVPRHDQLQCGSRSFAHRGAVMRQDSRHCLRCSASS